MALGRLAHDIQPAGESLWRQARRKLLNDVCTSYLQPENGLCHVGVLEVGCAGVPGVLGHTIVQVDHLGPTHLQQGKKEKH